MTDKRPRMDMPSCVLVLLRQSIKADRLGMGFKLVPCFAFLDFELFVCLEPLVALDDGALVPFGRELADGTPQLPPDFRIA